MKRFVVNGLLLILSLAFAVLVFEIGLRVAGVSYPMLQTHDEARGFALRAGAAGWWRREGEAYVRINRDGLRDEDHAVAKPENTIRIAVLGDSYAEARSVALEDTFWSVMERRLGSCAAMDGQAVEVINFGVTDYGTAQELITLRRHVWRYDPDLVLLAFFADNDVRNNSSVLERKKYRPFFDLVDGELVLDRSFLDSRPYRMLSSWHGRLMLFLSDYLVSLQVAREGFVRWFLKKKRPSGTKEAVAADRGAGAEPGLEGKIYAEPADEAWRAAWEVTEVLVSTIAREVRDRGAKFLMVTLSTGLQTNPDPQIRRAQAEAFGVEDLWYPDRRLAALAEQQGFEVLSLARPLQRYAEQNSVFLHGFANTEPGTGHWNEEGHRVAGELIAKRICEQWQDSR